MVRQLKSQTNYTIFCSRAETDRMIWAETTKPRINRGFAFRS